MKRKHDLENCTVCNKALTFKEGQRGRYRRYCSTSCKNVGRSWFSHLKKSLKIAQNGQDKDSKRQIRNAISKVRHEEEKIKARFRNKRDVVY